MESHLDNSLDPDLPEEPNDVSGDTSNQLDSDTFDVKSEPSQPETQDKNSEHTDREQPQPDASFENSEAENNEQSAPDATFKSAKDIYAPASNIGQFNINYYGRTPGSRSNPSEEKYDFSRVIPGEMLEADRKNYLERPGFNDALSSLSQNHRLLLVIGPKGCGLHASVNALSHDLSKKIKNKDIKIYSFPHLLPLSPDMLVRKFSPIENSISIFEDGIQTPQSFIYRLLGEREEAGFEHLNDQLRNMGSWVIVSGPVEPSNSEARKLYDLFRRQKRVVEIGMPNIQDLFERVITQFSGSRAADLINFASENFSESVSSLKTSQDVEFFARKYISIFNEENDPQKVVSQISDVIRSSTNIQRDVMRLFEEELIDSDEETLLAILLSALNGNVSSMFWHVYNHVKNSSMFASKENDQSELDDAKQAKDDSQKENVNRAKSRKVFSTSRLIQLKRIHAEEIEKIEGVNGEEVTVKVVKFIDDRYAQEIKRYSRMYFEDQISEICNVIEQRYVQEEKDVNIRKVMASVVATLSQSNWNGSFVPIVTRWAISQKQSVRASVGYALDQVLMEDIYSGNVRSLLNKWCAEHFNGEAGWNIKWTVAAACKQIGLRDIRVGLEYLRRLASFVGQRDVGKAKTESELVSMILDSHIESYLVYSAIQYAMVVYCMQGYLEQVMKELHEWTLEPLDKNPLNFLATALVLGIFQEFGYLTVEAQKAGSEKEWHPDVLSEWNIQIFSTTMKKSYICNQVLQHLIQNHSNNELLETISVALARTFTVAKLIDRQGLVYAILFQWVEELGQDPSNVTLRETTFKIQKILIEICKILDGEYVDEIRSQLTIASTSKDLSTPIQDFSKRVLRDLSAPSFRYSTRVSRS